MELHDRATNHDFSGTDLSEPPRCGLEKLPPPDTHDAVIEHFKKDVDVELLRENLKLTPDQRSRKFEQCMALADELRRAGHEVPRWPLLDLTSLEKAHHQLCQDRRLPAPD
jgi:hypothetical protein